jgi:hypothetical protein
MKVSFAKTAAMGPLHRVALTPSPPAQLHCTIAHDDGTFDLTAKAVISSAVTRRSADRLREAPGRPSPDFRAAAARLGIDEDRLRRAMVPEPPERLMKASMSEFGTGCRLR